MRADSWIAWTRGAPAVRSSQATSPAHELSGCAGGGVADRHDDPPGRGKEAPCLIERVHGEGCSRDLQGV